MEDILYLVVPCYNEEEVITETAKRLLAKMNSLISASKISKESKVLFVDDGSKDNTWQLIKKLHEENPLFRGLKLSRNRGHQNALLAGLMVAADESDMAISMDADLQDDINAIDEMVEKHYAGYDIVYGVRNSRETDTFFKRNSALGFYKTMSLLGADTVYNHADYRLMSRRAIKELANFNEVNLFLRGLVPMIGFKSTTVEYRRTKRFAGESKYPLKKMLAFAWEGITSLSSKPIKLITTLGTVLFLVGICFFIGVIVKLITQTGVTDRILFTALLFSLFGLQIIAVGVVGEYVGKIYLEAKNRPRYIIETYLND